MTALAPADDAAPDAPTGAQTEAQARRSKTRSEAQKQRRRDLWLARADDRMNAEKVALLERYEDLKRSMARVGLKIGTLKDIDAKLDDPVGRFEMLKARVERWDALWSITMRKRETRGKIIIGGALLAALADLDPTDTVAQAHRAWLFSLLDERVLRVRDRSVVRELLTDADGEAPPLPLRPGGPMDESIEDALAALGQGLSAFEQRAYGGGQYDHDTSEEADFAGFGEP